MKASAYLGPGWEDDSLEVVWEGNGRVLCRLWRDDAAISRHALLPVPSGQPRDDGIARLTHECELRDHLHPDWALQPVELLRERGQVLLVVDYVEGRLLERAVGRPMEIGLFLKVAVALCAALREMHAQGLIHKDINPGNVLVNAAGDRVWLTGFGIASRLPRERQQPRPPEYIEGSLPYMAPEQTGRVNRSVDSRSDLYSLGITLYELLTGGLPFLANDPMEWVHCHIARQAEQPADRESSVPGFVSAIVMKLIAKAAEDRYQTAAGAEADFRRCLEQWQAGGRIDDATPGEHDTPDHLMIPEALYGRDREIAKLLGAFDRVVAGGRPELVLVSGYSGIGKSAVVNELHKWLVPPRGLFASGKFDQYKRDIPYATLAQAFSALIRPLLGKSEDELGKWRQALLEALEPNGLLMTDLVPELKHIIGEQPPVPELPPQAAQGRFQLVFRRFIGVFARPEHPLALFLDDLQWLDAATLDLMEDLLTQTDLQNLLLIGAYRDNEVHASHPLTRKLEAIRQAGASLQNIVLAPLSRGDVTALLADTLRCLPANAAPLANMIHEKTNGNPFFSIQFLSMLADEGLLAFDYADGSWAWNLDRIHAKGYTDNVVDLMVGKLNRLPLRTQQALQQFACMGNTAEFAMLQMVYQESAQQLHEHLWEAVRRGLVYRSDTAYRFLHDRVQEAAYSLIPAEERDLAHLRIGRLLAAHTPVEQREEAVFEIVNQLNRGSHLIESAEERQGVSALNLMAGRRAKAATAYESALRYLKAGTSLLPLDPWRQCYALAFESEYLMAECELLTADMVAAENRLTQLAQCAENRHDLCIATRSRLTLYTAIDQAERGVEVFLEWLAREGTVWAKHPTRDDGLQEYERVWVLLAGRPIEDLVDLPLVTDPDVLDTVDVFTEIVTPSLLFDENLATLVVCRLVNLSLEHGVCDGSCFAFVWLAMFAGHRFNNYQDGFRFGQIGCDLVEKRGLTRYQARTFMSMGSNVLPWARHPASGKELVRRAFDVAYRMGDLTFAAYSCCQLVTVCLAAGDRLDELLIESGNSLEFARKSGFGLVVDICLAQFGLIRSLRDTGTQVGCLDHPGYSENEAEHYLASNPNLALAEFYYWTRKTQARVLSGDYACAADASFNAHRLISSSTAMFETAEHRFYGALAHALAWHHCDSAAERQAHIDALMDHHRQLEVWARNNPATFENRFALVAAELARIEGRTVDAQALYEAAVRSAHQFGYDHNEALANELAGRFYLAAGLDKVAAVYLRDARLCFLRWGAEAKVRELEQQFPHLRPEATVAVGGGMILAEHLDLATVMKVSEAVSGEIVQDKLVSTLMRAAIEHAGADRGLLLLAQDDEYRIEAEGTIHGTGMDVDLQQRNASGADLPGSILRYVIRTREVALLGDATQDNAFSSDPYLLDQRVRSVLCLPILKQGRMLGLLYLENRLILDAFNPTRLAIVKLLSSLAATSLENARLYQDLAERESRIRRLVDANIIGIFIWDWQGRIIEANDAFLRMVGYDREDLVTPSVRWTDLTPPEWRKRDEQHFIPELKLVGSLQPFEKEFFRKDGSRVPVLMGVATFQDGGNQGVAFVVDLTERRHAADVMRELQFELAHANRLATMGQLVATIAHEVNQPIGATRNNAHAALRFLAGDAPDLAEVKEALECVISDTYRASDIVGRVREQIKKAPPRKEDIDINEALGEVVALVRGELTKHRVLLATELVPELPPAYADRVQVQQVALNLIVNAIEAMTGADRDVRTLSIQTGMSTPGFVMVSVIDSGPGVSPEGRERIFESFYTTKASGVGIGLSICRSIVEVHGGRLWCEANEPHGSVFRFTVPVRV